MRSNRKTIVALGVTAVVVLLSAAPASATVVTGEVIAGTMLIDPNFGYDPIEVGLAGENLGSCDPWDGPPMIDVDIDGTATSGTTEVTALDERTARIRLGYSDYVVEVGLGAGDNTGTYTGSGGFWVVDQDLSLAIDVYESCNQIDHVCHLELHAALAGDFVGTISPPASGWLVLDGEGELAASSCDLTPLFAFHGAPALVDDLTIVI